jgi:hypothetical protein
VYPFERFDEDAKKVLTLAQQEAARAKHSYIGTEHLLLGVVRSDGGGRRVLDQLGVEEAAVRRTIESVLGRNEPVIIQQIIPTSRVKKVIEISFEVARRESSSHVSSEHLLVGLLEEGEGVAAHVLEDLGAGLDAVQVARGLVGAAPWPQPGERVLVHDEEPPYRLWEGSVLAHAEHVVAVSVPDHPTRPQVAVSPRELHSIPTTAALRCERCRYRTESQAGGSGPN